MSKIIFSIFMILLGGFLFVYGEYDDSPGGQLIGVAAVIIGAVGVIKNLKMAIDIELTLNRFGFGKISENKFQLFCFRFSKWEILGKSSISFEINWRNRDK